MSRAEQALLFRIIGSPDVNIVKIIYEDETILVVDKPAGMLTHPAGKNVSGTLLNALLSYSEGFQRLERAGIVHRLDRDTSGIIVVAKNNLAYRSLKKQFKEREIKKKYLAVVKGKFPFDKEEFKIPLGRKGDQITRGLTFKEGKEAITKFRVLRTFEPATFLEVFPKTGRTHQIRATLFFLGYPIIGDRKYGGKKTEIDGLIGRQALHSSTIGFLHPSTKKYLIFTAPLPEDMERLLQSLRE